MKRITIILLACMISFAGFSQKSGSPVDKIYAKYAGKDGYTALKINSALFRMMSNVDINDPEYQKVKNATTGINDLLILTQDGPKSTDFGKELLAQLPRSQYTELMTVEEKDETVLFLIREEGDKVIELLLIVSGKDEDVLIAIRGDIDMDNIASLAKSMDLPGMEDLEELKDKMP